MNGRTSISNNEIVKKFRLGVKKCCGVAIWQSIEKEVSARISVDGQSVTQDRVANYFYLNRSDVTKGLADGSLSLEVLVTILTQLDWSFGRLDQSNMPDKNARAVAGYQEAVRLVESRDPNLGEETISASAFLSLCALLGDGQYFRLDARDELDDEAWQSILMRVLPRIATWLDLPNVNHLPYKTIPQFKDLRQKWGNAVARCIIAIPYCNWVGREV